MAVITIDAPAWKCRRIKMYWNVRWKPEFIFRTSAIIGSAGEWFLPHVYCRSRRSGRRDHILYLRAQDGMVVHTTSERINKLRTLALELLLAGHPEDCSTCPKYGNCELQTLIQYIGANNARMRTRIKGIKMEEGNPLLIHDMNRCVLCGRCVRACNKLRGVGVLQYNKKELETYVGTLHGKLLKDEDCRFCTACAEVCPTGSIRDKLQLLTTNLKKKRHWCRVVPPVRLIRISHVTSVL